MKSESLTLVIWDERAQGSDEVTIHFGDKSSNVKVHDPTVGAEPVQRSAGIGFLKLTLSDHPFIVAIAPR